MIDFPVEADTTCMEQSFSQQDVLASFGHPNPQVKKGKKNLKMLI